jgi:hypothetical protein
LLSRLGSPRPRSASSTPPTATLLRAMTSPVRQAERRRPCRVRRLPRGRTAWHAEARSLGRRDGSSPHDRLARLAQTGAANRELGHDRDKYQQQRTLRRTGELADTHCGRSSARGTRSTTTRASSHRAELLHERYRAKFLGLCPVKPGVEPVIEPTIERFVEGDAYCCRHGSDQTYRRPASDPFSVGAEMEDHRSPLWTVTTFSSCIA